VGIERKLNKRGEAFAVVTLEDFTGKRECVFWGKEYRDYTALLAIERPIAISGRIKKNGTSETATIITSNAMSIEAARSSKTRGVVIKLESNGEKPEHVIESLKSVIKRYEGNRTTYVVVEDPTLGESRKYILPQAYKVTGDDDFVAEIESRFGKNKVLYCR
jgi:DNA polymerase-3 subunit alpha